MPAQEREIRVVNRPRLLDLFCGAGGAAMGYHRAGFDVVGVDIKPQPHYPFTSLRADGLEFLSRPGRFVWPPGGTFDAIHASPPCQGYVGWQNIGTARGGTNDWPRLIEPIRELLDATGLPYVIENVENAPLQTNLVLCGSMFGLGVRRHRKFETSFAVLGRPASCAHTGDKVGVYGKLDGRRLFTRADGSELHNPSSLEQAQTAMGIDWMEWDELKEAIPPAYTQWIGSQLMNYVEVAA